MYTFQEGRKVYIFSNTLVSEVLHVVMSYMQFTRTRYLENESRGYIQVHLYTCLIQDDFGYLMEKPSGIIEHYLGQRSTSSYVPCRCKGSLSGPLRLPPQLAAATVIVYASPGGLILSRIEHV